VRRYIVECGVYRYIDGEEFMVKNVTRHSETGEKLVVFQRIRPPRYTRAMPFSLFASKIPDGTESDVNEFYLFEFVRETISKGAVR
jgi:hypothetical protein